MSKRTLGRLNFAATGDLRALHLLAEEYATVDIAEERGTLVSLATRYYGRTGPGNSTVYRWWRQKRRDRSDAWLWYRILARTGEGLEDWQSIKPAAIRASVLEALATNQDPKVLLQIQDLLATLPKDDALDREMVVGAIAAVVLAHRSRRDDSAFRVAATALARLLDAPETSPRPRG